MLLDIDELIYSDFSSNIYKLASQFLEFFYSESCTLLLTDYYGLFELLKSVILLFFIPGLTSFKVLTFTLFLSIYTGDWRSISFEYWYRDILLTILFYFYSALTPCILYAFANPGCPLDTIFWLFSKCLVSISFSTRVLRISVFP